MLKKFLILVLITTINSALLAQTVTSLAQNTATERQQYTCVMHPEVIQNHPGKCPKCGMELVPVNKGKKRPTSKNASPARTQRSTPNAEMDHAMHHHHGLHGHEGHAMHEMKMQSSVNLTDPMAREGSGTSWLPDSSPMYGRMFMFGDDMLMISSANYLCPIRKNLATIFQATSISVTPASRRSARPRSCIAFRQWTIQTHRSAIIGRIQVTSRLVLPLPA